MGKIIYGSEIAAQIRQTLKEQIAKILSYHFSGCFSGK